MWINFLINRKNVYSFYESHEKNITKISEINEEFQQNKNQSICYRNRIKVNENEERIEKLNQK